MVHAALRRSLKSKHGLQGIPPKFTLNTGHVKFFYDKGEENAGKGDDAAAIKSIETGTVPPTINLETPDNECDLDYVPNIARTNQAIDRVLINGFGFGGQNASALFGKLR